ncbi:unnamed protein product [Paramecium sonneborni]|uniref:Transmembrane protein n=1 Tax=Paramecium sonneborni TaxID=65129 RepID=A0A8S1MLA7_9CILI|nr:unnamed protein product [Paramecium sonneborni]
MESYQEMNSVMMEILLHMMDVLIVNINVKNNAQNVLKESVLNVLLQDGKQIQMQYHLNVKKSVEIGQLLEMNIVIMELEFIKMIAKCIDCELIGFKPLAYFCINICGDGLVVSHPYGFSEECDDGNTFNNDGCNSNCQFECYQGSKCKICRYGNCLECVTGYNLVDDLCVVNQDPSCNDNFILPYKGCQNFKPMCQTSCEQCDMFGKGCLNCKTGYKIIDYLCYSICGDNIVTIDEQCDDGNILYGDGCHQCQFSCSHTCIDCIKGRCQECIDGFELYLYQCKPISLQLNNCQLLCDSNCLICQCGICQVCSNGYYLSQNNEFCIQQSTFLSQFIDYCKIQIDYTCLVCQDLAYLDQFKQICVIMSNSCVKNCQLCIEDYCIQCQSGYYGTKCLPQLGEGIIIGEDICYSSGTQILNDNFECNHNCDKNCLNCYNGRCYLCQNRSYLFNNQCIQEHFLEITYVKDGYAQCGDSILGMNEQCDDGNNYIFDGCYDCKYQCDQFCEQCIFGICTSCIQGLILNSNNICEPLCGDNLVIPYSNEQCDDINNSNCVNCHYQCQQYCVDCNLLQCFQCQIGFQVNMNECQPFCGDGIVINNFENCDDGNDIQFDGCYNCEFQCTQYCSICNEGICSECIENYQLVDNSCNQISNNEEQENPNDNGNTDENSNIDESGNTDENGNTTNDNIDEQNDENNKYPNDNDKGSADTQNSKNNTNSNGKSDSTNNSINNNKTNSNNPNINQGLLEQKNEPILFEMACRNNECVFSQKPRMLLVYINQIFSQQTIHIKFDQEVKLDQTTQINNQMFTITIANLNTQDYKIIVESLKDISSDLQFIEYQVIIDIFVQLESKPNLIVQLDQEITNQNNQTISNNNQTILLEIPKILSQKNKQTSITMQKSNKGFIIGALSIASISLLSGESSIFIETFNVLQYQSYFKFINVDYPENLFLYFEAQDMLSVQSYINFLQIDDFLKFITGYQNQTQIQLVGKFELYNIEIDLLTNIFPQIFQCFLMVAFFACAGKLFQLYLKLRAYKNFLQILNSTKSKILTPILSSILMISYNIKLFIKMRYFSSQNSIRQLIQLNAWDLIFKIFLSIQNHPINNFRNVISNLISFLILITFINFILKSIQSQLKNKNIKKKSDIQFITLDMVRTSIFHFVLVFFQKQQMLQSLLIFIINLSQCLVIFKYKQCSKAEKYVSLIIEGILSIFTLTLICYTKTAEMYLSPQNIITLGFIHMYLLLSTLLIVFIKQLIPQVLKISQLKCKNNQEKRASNLLFF